MGARWGCGGVGQLGHVPLALYHVLISTSPDHHVIRVTVSCGLAYGQVRGDQLGGVSPQLSRLLADRGTNPALACGGEGREGGIIPLLGFLCLQRSGVGEGNDFGCMPHPLLTPISSTSCVNKVRHSCCL